MLYVILISSLVVDPAWHSPPNRQPFCPLNFGQNLPLCMNFKVALFPVDGTHDGRPAGGRVGIFEDGNQLAAPEAERRGDGIDD